MLQINDKECVDHFMAIMLGSYWYVIIELIQIGLDTFIKWK